MLSFIIKNKYLEVHLQFDFTLDVSLDHIFTFLNFSLVTLNKRV